MILLFPIKLASLVDAVKIKQPMTPGVILGAAARSIMDHIDAISEPPSQLFLFVLAQAVGNHLHPRFQQETMPAK